MKVFLILLLTVFYSCSNKPKSVLICGDHICVNKAEARQYFEENLSIEIKIINDEKKRDIDLVELNLNNENNKKKISINKKRNTRKKIKSLSSQEVKKIKSNLKKKKIKRNKKKSTEITKINNKNDINKKFNKKILISEDVCTIIKKCSIEDISKYLINEGNKKDFPDITTRQ